MSGKGKLKILHIINHIETSRSYQKKPRGKGDG